MFKTIVLTYFMANVLITLLYLQTSLGRVRRADIQRNVFVLLFLGIVIVITEWNTEK